MIFAHACGIDQTSLIADVVDKSKRRVLQIVCVRDRKRARCRERERARGWFTRWSPSAELCSFLSDLTGNRDSETMKIAESAR